MGRKGRDWKIKRHQSSGGWDETSLNWKGWSDQGEERARESFALFEERWPIYLKDIKISIPTLKDKRIMQNFSAEVPLKRKITAEGPREDGFKVYKAERDLRPNKRKQRETEERSPKHRNNRHDLLDLRVNNEALDLIQITLKDMVRKDLKYLDRAQQPQDLIIEEIDDLKVEVKRSQIKRYTHEIV